MNEIPKGAIIEEISICGCTGEQLERGETCGQANCPNGPKQGGVRALRHSRFLEEEDEPYSAVPTQEGGIDDQALKLLFASPALTAMPMHGLALSILAAGSFLPPSTPART